MLCGAVSRSEMVPTSPRVDDGLSSLQWLLRPPACDVSVPGASGRGSQPGGGPARRREPPLSAPHHHHQTHPVISCRQPVSSPRVPLSPLAADPATPFQTTTLACSLTQKSLPGTRGTRGKKPPYTYPMMICMAMQASRKSSIAASSIYQWFMDNFPYFRHHDKPDSWKSSIRHNLSTIKEFTSVSRQGDDPGKGGFWTVDPQFAECILLRALDKWISDFKNDPSLPSPLVQIPLLPSPPLPSPLPVSSLEQKQPGKDIGRLKRKTRPDSTATMAKVPRRSSSLVLQTEEQKELDGLFDWVLSRELGPIQQHQGPELCDVATSAVSCAAPSPPSGALGWPPQSPLVHQLLDSALSREPSLDSGEPLSTSPIEDNLTVNFDWDLDVLPGPIEDSTLSGELGLYSEEPLSRTSPMKKDVILTFDWDDWDTLLGSALSEEPSVDSGEPPC